MNKRAAAPSPTGIFDKLDGEELKSAGYWKPVSVGQVLLGKVEGFASKMFPGGKGKGPNEARSAILAHAVTFGPDGAVDGAFHKIKAPLNSTLVEKIGPDTVGKCLALVYMGDEVTPAGSMRVFRAKVIAADRHAAAWTGNANLATDGTAAIDDDDTDGLPF